jgi:hypothetical protein
VTKAATSSKTDNDLRAQQQLRRRVVSSRTEPTLGSRVSLRVSGVDLHSQTSNETDPKATELGDRLKPYADISIANASELPVSVSRGMTGRKEQNSPETSTQNSETDQNASNQPDQSDE